MKYNLYFYDGGRNAVIMINMAGKKFVCQRKNLRRGIRIVPPMQINRPKQEKGSNFEKQCTKVRALRKTVDT